MDKIVAGATFQTRGATDPEFEGFVWCFCDSFTVKTEEGKEIQLAWDREEVDFDYSDGFGFSVELENFGERSMKDCKENSILTVKQLASLQVIEANYTCFMEDEDGKEIELSSPLDLIMLSLWDQKTGETAEFSQENLDNLNKQNDRYWKKHKVYI